jgi:hypothetical protein
MAVKSDQVLTFKKVRTCSIREIGTHSNSSSFNIAPKGKKKKKKKKFRDTSIKRDITKCWSHISRALESII